MTVHDCYRLGFGEPVAVSASTGEGMVDLYGALQPFIDAAARARASRGVFLPPVVQRPEQRLQQRGSPDSVAAAAATASRGESSVALSRRAAAEATEAGRSGQSGPVRSAGGSAAGSVSRSAGGSAAGGWADGLDEASTTASSSASREGGPVSLHPSIGRAPGRREFDGRGSLVQGDEAEEEGEEEEQVASDDEASESADEDEEDDDDEGVSDGTQEEPDIIRMAILGQPNVVSEEAYGSVPPLGAPSPLWAPFLFRREGTRIHTPTAFPHTAPTPSAGQVNAAQLPPEGAARTDRWGGKGAGVF